MKKTAIVVLLSSLFFAGMFLPGAEQADHSGSPAYSASLERAISMLEGAGVEVTAAAVPDDGAEPMPVTVDITCDSACGHTELNTCELTINETCETTCDPGVSTCDYTCNPVNHPECEVTYDTCDPAMNPECQVTYDTCDPAMNPQCEPTQDTCVGQPGCPSSSTDRTSWGAIKDMF